MNRYATRGSIDVDPIKIDPDRWLAALRLAYVSFVGGRSSATATCGSRTVTFTRRDELLLAIAEAERAVFARLL